MLPALRHFADSLPRRPYCTDDPYLGQTVRGRVEALKFANIQPNTSGKVVWLAFDVDHVDGATAWDRLSAPPPTLAVENPANGHAHLLYALQTPVPRTEAARARPLLYLAAAQEGLRRKLEADPGYSGHLCKNPLHERWQTRQWAQTYSLAELSEWVDLPRIPEQATGGHGVTRSPTFFRDARQQPPKGLDSHGNPLPEAEPRRVNGYLVKPPMRWTKDSNGRVLPLNSAAWRKLRKQVLAEEPLCRHCAAQGLTVPATEVDHMRGAADNSRDALQALCKPCHSIKTMADLYGRPARMGCDEHGMPINPAHPWNEKSPGTEADRPTGSPSFNAHCLKNRQS